MKTIISSTEITVSGKKCQVSFLGLHISGTTLTGCLIYLAYDGTKRWRLRRQKYHLDLRVKK